jgi:dTDP-4-amino-4,6-dideoxygalactose transaminase
VCESLFENGLCMPSGSNLNEEDKKRIISALEIFFNN